MEKICKYCNKTYNAKHSTSMFCSKKCVADSLKTKITINCEYCNREFEIKLSEYNKNNHHYCSVKCKKDSAYVNGVCDNCGQEFSYRASTKKNNKYIYCSAACRDKHLSKQQPTNKEIVTCKMCGVEFASHTSNHRKFCSTDCSYNYIKQHRKDEYVDVFNYKTAKKAQADLFSYAEKHNIDILSEYVNAKVKLLCRCTIHNEEFEQIPSGIKSGKIGCPKCIPLSHGEKAIRDFLDRNNISYTSQYRFDDCKDIRPLPFDFYIENQGIAIEYDGQQHCKVMNWHNITEEEAIKEYNTVKKHDEIKTHYCNNHDIKLIRIPYDKYNEIDDILKNNLL